ncbi:tyrosine-protein phosphatase, partial [Streptomyces sp. NPDC006874]|uniref:tyrosine-protein phosphatase n=1 Tax=Streptomyces sp. NPDC006874 TaxID=3157189 RepID=UPI0034002FC1
MQTARAVPATTIVNLRDLGGIALGRHRRLRQGILLRSGQLSDFDAEHDRAVAALGIRTVVDLRTLQPKMKAIQERYKNDKQRQSEEMMKLYKETGT